MRYFIKQLSERIESQFPIFKDHNYIIESMVDFKKNGINDYQKDKFYFRLKNLKDLKDTRVLKSKSDGLRTFNSKWVGVFQIAKGHDIENVYSKLVNAVSSHDECISNIAFTDNTDKIYKNETSIKTKEDSKGSFDYPFDLYYLEFDLSIEVYGKICIPENC